MTKTATLIRKAASLMAVLILLGSCVEREGYYTQGEQEFIDLLCASLWVHEKTYPDGAVMQTCYDFQSDATYTKVYRLTDAEGREDVASYKYRWAFGDEYFTTICFSDTEEHWEIKELKADRLCVYCIRGESGTPSYHREYLEFHPGQEQ